MLRLLRTAATNLNPFVILAYLACASILLWQSLAWVTAAQGRLFAQGYTDNFVKPIVGMIQELGDATEPAVLCDLVPRKEAS